MEKEETCERRRKLCYAMPCYAMPFSFARDAMNALRYRHVIIVGIFIPRPSFMIAMVEG
jgi:hypothetical protein